MSARGISASDAADLQARAAAVRDRVRLSDVIGRDVKLVRSGDEHDGLCPFHPDRNIGSFKVNDGKGFYHCFSCGAHGDVIDYLSERKSLTFMQALRQLQSDAGIDFSDAKQKAEFDRRREAREREEADAREKKRLNAWYLWKHAAKMQGTPVQAYLEGRGIDFARLGKFPGAIRYRHDCWNSERKCKMPAMVTAMVGVDGLHMATHRTYLHYERGRWTKAPLADAKKILGAFRGAHIPLWKGADGTSLARAKPGSGVRISEGIEDGLTVAMALPVARVVSAAAIENISRIVLPDAIDAVELIAQRDPPGSAADETFQRQIARIQATGRRVMCLWPAPGFKDFNDQLMGKRMQGEVA